MPTICIDMKVYQEMLLKDKRTGAAILRHLFGDVKLLKNAFDLAKIAHRLLKRL